MSRRYPRSVGPAIVLVSTLAIASAAPPAASAVYPTVPTWTGPAEPTRAIAVGDVDMDGDLDLIRGNDGAGATLYLNEGGALRTTPSWTGPAEKTYAIALGDVDGDGDLDLVLGNLGQPTKLFLNEGSGFASTPAWSSAADNTRSVALADVNGDDRLDLVCGNFGQASTLYLNIGGIFASTPVWTGLAANTTSLTMGDLDGDEQPDLLLGNTNEGSCGYLNHGGTFGSSPDWRGSIDVTVSVGLGDVDADGDLDLVCGNFSAGATLFLNIAGVLDSLPAWTGPVQATTSVTLGDVDGDGRLDLITGNSGQPATLFRNSGGTFVLTPENAGQSEATQAVALADLDGDADLELLRGNLNGTATEYDNQGALLERTAAWTSTATFLPQFASPDGLGLAVGDVNRDGAQDFVIGGSAGLFLNFGGTFGSVPNWTISFPPGRHPDAVAESVALADFNRDGYLDLELGESSGPTGSAPLGSPYFVNLQGSFGASPSGTLASPTGGRDVLYHDVNGDTWPDLVRANTFRGCFVHLNSFGLLPFTPSDTIPTARTISLAIGDVSGDDIADLVVGGTFTTPAAVYAGTGTGFAHTPVWTGSAEDTWAIALGDVDGDSDLDLVRGNASAPATLYRNISGSLGSSPVWTGPAEGTRAVSLSDMDADGDLDLVRGNNTSGSTIYLNQQGVFAPLPNWAGPPGPTRSIGVADFDSDGRLDLVQGCLEAPATMFRGKSPWLELATSRRPLQLLTENPAHLRRARIASADSNHQRIQFLACDAESDPMWIVGEWQFAGSSHWSPMNFGGATRVGPLTTSAAGAGHEVLWDISSIPFDRREVEVRLRAISTPRHSGAVQFVPTYQLAAGALTPARPEAIPSPRSLRFRATTVGDTAEAAWSIRNTGNRDLVVDSLSPSDLALELDVALPLVVGPGQTRDIEVRLVPRTSIDAQASIRMRSNDPLRPEVEIPVMTDVRTLSMRTQLLSAAADLPLGEAATVMVTPAESVHVERGHLFFRHATPAGAPFDSTELVPLGAQFLALIPGQRVTEGGIEYYVEVENSGLFALDPPSAPALPFHQPVAPPRGVTSVIRSGAIGGHPTGLPVVIGLSVPQGTLALDARVLHRAGGTSLFDTTETVAFVPGTTSVDVTIPGESVGPRGVEFRAQVRTQTEVLEDPADLQAVPNLVTTDVAALTEDGSHAGKAYRMLSFPLDFSRAPDASIESFLSDDLGALDPTRWRVFHWDPATAAYLEPPAAAGALAPRPGRAFWLVTRDEHRVGSAPIPGRSVATAGPFQVTLAPGWNQVADPFLFPVLWRDVLVEGIQTVTTLEPPVTWEAATGSYSPTTGAEYADTLRLRPFTGYWVHNPTATPITLLVPPREAPTVIPVALARANAGSTRTASGEAWRIRVGATIGAASDPWNIAGTAEGAQSAVDSFDRTDPPLEPGEAISLCFLSEGTPTARRAADLRAPLALSDVPGEQGRRWVFEVFRGGDASRTAAARISVDGFESVPEGLGVRLLDRAWEREVDLREQHEYDYVAHATGTVDRAEQARFELLVGTPAYLDAARADRINTALATGLRPVSPNPVVSNGLIRFDLARPGVVRVELFDPSGRRVRTIVDGFREAGRHEALWQGDDDRGRALSPGVYSLRLTAVDRTEVRKLVRIR